MNVHDDELLLKDVLQRVTPTRAQHSRQSRRLCSNQLWDRLCTSIVVISDTCMTYSCQEVTAQHVIYDMYKAQLSYKSDWEKQYPWV